jgi:nucleoporin NUP2
VTTHAVKSKCHIFGEKKSEDGKTVNAWIELGVGILRLKKQKESEARRILMRNSSSGRIILNFSLFEGFSTKLQPKGVLTFIGHDNEGNAKSYRVRVATETKAKELQEAIDQEVNALGVKGSQ